MKAKGIPKITGMQQDRFSVYFVSRKTKFPIPITPAGLITIPNRVVGLWIVDCGFWISKTFNNLVTAEVSGLRNTTVTTTDLNGETRTTQIIRFS